MPDSDTFAERLRINPDDKHQLGHSAGLLLSGTLAVLVAAAVLGITAFLRDEHARTLATPLRTALTANAEAPQPRPDVPPLAPASLEATGYVVATRSVSVAPEVGGVILESPFEEGQDIKQGQVMARLSCQAARDEAALRESQLASEIAALEEITANLRTAQAQLKRSEALVKHRDVSQETFENDQLSVARQVARARYQGTLVEVARRNLQVARNNLELYTVRAPISGVLSKKVSQVGEYVSPSSYTNTVLGMITDPRSIVAEITVSETNLSKVALGQPVRVTLNGYPDAAFAAHVSSISPQADRQSGTVKIQASFDTLDARMRPESGVRAAFLQR